MKSRIGFVSALFIFAAIPVAAQPAAEAAAEPTVEPTEEITVFAPFVVRSTSTRGGVSTITMSRAINFHDLNLANDGDVTALKQRVNDTARAICRQLDRRFSGGRWQRTPQDRDCVQNASNSALAEVDMVVAAVRGKPS